MVGASSTRIRKVIGSTPGNRLAAELEGLTLNPALLVEMLQRRGMVNPDEKEDDAEEEDRKSG